ncbi:MAG: sigma-70 family RNA polymerase sigma factor [Butyrivibrio sp.]|nr:sigma-70 family RNA polymerase sigma factor [Butyrivibrio sp.]
MEVGKITARYEDGMPIEKIAEKTKVSVQVVKDVLKKAGLI